MQKLLEGTASIFGVLTLRYFILAGIPFLIFYYWLHNRFSKLKIQKKAAGRTDFWREILHSVQSTAVFAIASALILLTPFRQHTQVYTQLHDYPLWWVGVSLLLTLIVHDTYFYWTHRLMHHKSIFKYAHLLHHKSTNPSPWTSYAFHILEAVVEVGILLVIVMIMPLHPITIMLFTVVGFIINVYGHLGYEIMPRGFRNTVWFEILNTSVHHNLHHSKFKGNYGLYFRVWDRLMGTEHPDYVKDYDRVQAQRFGGIAKDVIEAEVEVFKPKTSFKARKYKAA
ncbi:sterol desaturase family protein [Mucilaginibacter koreensis]